MRKIWELSFFFLSQISLVKIISLISNIVIVLCEEFDRSVFDQIISFVHSSHMFTEHLLCTEHSSGCRECSS